VRARGDAGNLTLPELCSGRTHGTRAAECAGAAVTAACRPLRAAPQETGAQRATAARTLGTSFCNSGAAAAGTPTGSAAAGASALLTLAPMAARWEAQGANRVDWAFDDDDDASSRRFDAASSSARGCDSAERNIMRRESWVVAFVQQQRALYSQEGKSVSAGLPLAVTTPVVPMALKFLSL